MDIYRVADTNSEWSFPTKELAMEKYRELYTRAIKTPMGKRYYTEIYLYEDDLLIMRNIIELS